MTVEEAIWSRVANLATVQAIAGSRVYLDQNPQSPIYPMVRVQLVSEHTDYHLRGPVNCNRSRVQIDAYARVASGVDAYARANELMDAIDGDGQGTSASGIEGWIGAVGSPPVDVIAVYRVARTRRWDPDELQVVTISTDYLVWHR